MDPYEVLGVSRDADEETIKKAYKALVKKYHPDKYINSPMADVASEKMKEINRAYDMITKGETTKTDTGGYGGYGGYSGYSGYGGTNAQPSFQNVRILIQIGALSQAQQMLAALPRTAEWYYLSGIIYQRRGWYDKAAENIRAAMNADPNNAEYRAAYENMQNRAAGYTNSPYRGSFGCSDCCTLCLCLQCCNPSPCC